MYVVVDDSGTLFRVLNWLYKGCCTKGSVLTNHLKKSAILQHVNLNFKEKQGKKPDLILQKLAMKSQPKMAEIFS